MQKQDCSKHLELKERPKYLLERLFAVQEEFLDKFIAFADLSSTEKDTMSREYLEALTQECCELREELRWKSWKQYPKNFKHDEQNIRFEIADLMCFLMDLALVWGMDAKTFFDYVSSKQKLNFERQKDPKLGYVEEKK